MKFVSSVFAGMLLLATPVVAHDVGIAPDGQVVEVVKQQVVLNNPCNRGPLPRVRIINSAHTNAINFLQEHYPAMPYSTARLIASDLCDDVSLYGDSGGLTAHLNSLLATYGY